MDKELYLLQDGTHADPSDVSADKAGVLRHKNGLSVSLNEDGTPQTVAKAAELHGNVAAANAGKQRAAKPDELPLATTAKPTSDVKVGDTKTAAASHDPKAG